MQPPAWSRRTARAARDSACVPFPPHVRFVTPYCNPPGRLRRAHVRCPTVDGRIQLQKPACRVHATAKRRRRCRGRWRAKNPHKESGHRKSDRPAESESDAVALRGSMKTGACGLALKPANPLPDLVFKLATCGYPGLAGRSASLGITRQQNLNTSFARRFCFSSAPVHRMNPIGVENEAGKGGNDGCYDSSVRRAEQTAHAHGTLDLLCGAFLFGVHRDLQSVQGGACHPIHRCRPGHGHRHAQPDHGSVLHCRHASGVPGHDRDAAFWREILHRGHFLAAAGRFARVRLRHQHAGFPGRPHARRSRVRPHLRHRAEHHAAALSIEGPGTLHGHLVAVDAGGRGHRLLRRSCHLRDGRRRSGRLFLASYMVRVDHHGSRLHHLAGCQLQNACHP